MPTDIIQWFPGHMAKTRRIIGENLSLVDAVIDVRDARIPMSSANPEIARICESKPRLVVFNKSGLADSAESEAWMKKFMQKGLPCLLIDCTTGEGIKKIAPAIRSLCAEKLQKYEEKGMAGRRLRVMVLGIPNVGKSSLINRLAGSGKAKVENRPGVTRDKQWIQSPEGIDLLDMPGVLWPKFDERSVAEKLAATGAIKDDVLQVEEIAFALLKRLRSSYSCLLAERYRLDCTDDFGGIEDYELYEAIGRRRGFILKGGEIDTDRTAKALLEEFRNGKIGRITLDRCVNNA